MFPHDIFDLLRRGKLYAHAARRPSMVPNDIFLFAQKKKTTSSCAKREHVAFVSHRGPRAKAVFGETVGVHAGTRAVVCQFLIAFVHMPVKWTSSLVVLLC